MKKCFKCGNSVLPGTSTCPSCGNFIRNNTNTRQSYTPTSVKTADYTPKRVHDTVSPNTIGYSTNGNGGWVVLVILLIFVILPVVFVFNMVKSQVSDFKEESSILLENTYTEDESTDLGEYINPRDYILLNKVVKTESGEIVMFFENTYSKQLNVDVDLKYLDENGSELTKRFGVMDIAAGEEQVMVFSASTTAYRAYKYSYDVTDYQMADSATTIDTSKIVTNDTGEKLIATYLNEDTEDLLMVELCVLYYNDETLKYADCGRDYDISANEKVEIEFDYSYEANYKGLVFNKYEYYVHEVQGE